MAAELDKLAEQFRREHPEFADSLKALAQVGRAMGVPEEHIVEPSPEVIVNPLLSDPKDIQRRLVIALQESVDLVKPTELNEEIGVAMWEKVGKDLDPKVRIFDTLQLPEKSMERYFKRLDLDMSDFSLWNSQGASLFIRKSFTASMNRTSRKFPEVGMVQQASFQEIESAEGVGKLRSKFVAAFFQGPAERTSRLHLKYRY